MASLVNTSLKTSVKSWRYSAMTAAVSAVVLRVSSIMVWRVMSVWGRDGSLILYVCGVRVILWFFLMVSRGLFVGLNRTVVCI